MADLFSDPLEAATTVGLEISVYRLAELDARCRTFRARLLEHGSPALPSLIKQVRIHDAGITIVCATAAIADALAARILPNAPSMLELVAAARIARSGRSIRLVRENGTVAQHVADQALLRLIIRAQRWWLVLRQGELSVTKLAEQEGVTPSYLTRVTRAGFLSPKVVREMLAGRQRVNTNVKLLRHELSIPASWQDQEKMLLPR